MKDFRDYLTEAREVKTSSKKYVTIEDKKTGLYRAHVYDRAQVYDKVYISDDAQVYESSTIHQNAHVYGTAQVYGKAHVSGDVDSFIE